MAGRKIVRLTSGEENGFLPEPREDIEADLLYICSPNNPTGAVSVSYTHLKKQRRSFRYRTDCTEMNAFAHLSVIYTEVCVLSRIKHLNLKTGRMEKKK